MGNQISLQSGKKLLVLGFISITIIFILYTRYQDPVFFTPDATDSIQRIAYGFYILLFISFGAIFFGIYQYQKYKVEKKGKDLLSIIAIQINNVRSRKIFLITFIVYGIFFSLVSGTLVYQPEVNFIKHYGATIPSGFVAPCCGELGYMPKIIIYLTEHIGLQIIPINIVLQMTVSYLVGINMTIAVSAYTISKKRRGVGTIGAVAGLFIACPTCAGTFFSIFIGTASGIALSIALIQLQTMFIAISIPILLYTPFIMAKKIKELDNNCDTNSMK